MYDVKELLLQVKMRHNNNLYISTRHSYKVKEETSLHFTDVKLEQLAVTKTLCTVTFLRWQEEDVHPVFICFVCLFVVDLSLGSSPQLVTSFYNRIKMFTILILFIIIISSLIRL